MGYNPWGLKAERLTHTHTHTHNSITSRKISNKYVNWSIQNFIFPSCTPDMYVHTQVHTRVPVLRPQAPSCPPWAPSLL